MGYSMYRNLSQCVRVKNKHQKKIFKESLVDPGLLVFLDERLITLLGPLHVNIELKLELMYFSRKIERSFQNTLTFLKYL